MKKTIYSYDLFDTLVYRNTDEPVGIFYIMENKLSKMKLGLSNYFCSSFAFIRENCEKECRRLTDKPNHEIDIYDIYETMRRFYDLSEKQVQSLIELELETEKENLRANKEILFDLKQKYKNHEFVCIISDMYLYSAQLRYVLSDVDSIFNEISIFVSCEYGYGKGNGLYREVYNAIAGEYDEWVHYGDNYDADVIAAKKYGIKAVYKPKSELLEWEKEVNTKTAENQLILGASKNARAINTSKNIAFEIGSSVGFTCLMAYVKWVVDESLRRNIDNLFLLARDGFILETLFNRYCKKLDYKINIHYLYSSRVAWQIPEAEVAKRSLLKDYINQEIGDLNNIGIVDIQGTGTTIKYLHEVIPDIKINVFYMLRTEYFEIDNCTLLSYLVGLDDSFGFIVEPMTRALHGKTIGYNRNGDGKVEPVLVDDENIELQRYGYQDYIDGVNKATDCFFDNSSELIKSSNLDWICREYLKMMSAGKYASILDWFGDMPFSDCIDGEYTVLKFGPKLDAETLKAYIKQGWISREKFQGVSIKLSFLRATEQEKQEAIENIKKENIAPQKKKKEYRVNADELKPRLVIYGAGNVGKQIYEQLNNNSKFTIVKWVDKDAFAKRSEGLPVCKVSGIQDVAFDQIIIAVLRPNMADAITKELIDKGISKEKIYWSNYEQRISNE